MGSGSPGGRILVVAYIAGSIGLTFFLLYVMLVAAVGGWTVKLDFNRFGEAFPELVLLATFGVVGMFALTQAVK